MLTRTAEKLDVTESAYVSDTLKRILTVEPLIRNIHGIGVSKKLFREMLAQTNSAGFEILAAEIARENVSYAFELLGLELNISSMEWFMKEVLQSWGWFKIEFLH